jgi:methylmalonyl-CoA mutase C-terminal domain/subunit
MEVIYTGLRQTPDMVVQTALQEDVDAIGVSILSGAHMTVFPALIDLLKAHDLQHILLTGGGIIPEDDRKKLKEMGVDELFTPGTPTSDIAQYIQQKVKF